MRSCANKASAPPRLFLKRVRVLLHPVQRFGIAARFVKSVDDVQVSSFGSRIIRETVDESFIGDNCAVILFQANVTRGE